MMKQLIGKKITYVLDWASTIYLFTESKEVFKIEAFEGYSRGEVEIDTTKLDLKQIKKELGWALKPTGKTFIDEDNEELRKVVKEILK